jgi:uncharacterized protein YueI
MMPKPEEQRPHLSTFRRRVTQALIDAAQHQHPLTNAEAEQIVWRELEEILLSLID